MSLEVQGLALGNNPSMKSWWGDAKDGPGQMMPKGLGTWKVRLPFPLAGVATLINKQTNKKRSSKSTTFSVGPCLRSETNLMDSTTDVWTENLSKKATQKSARAVTEEFPTSFSLTFQVLETQCRARRAASRVWASDHFCTAFKAVKLSGQTSAEVPPSVPMYLGTLDVFLSPSISEFKIVSCFSDCSTDLRRSVTSTARTL